MQTKVRNRNETRLIRFGPCTSRPHSSLQPIWRGPPPQEVKKILTRDALEPHLRERYVEWASSFALLTDEFLASIFEPELDRIKKLACGKWTRFPFVDDWHFCAVGENYLWVQKQDRGWTVELCYPGADPDARILSDENMPVLCPDAVWAARVALACYPETRANLVWHSYW